MATKKIIKKVKEKVKVKSKPKEIKKVRLLKPIAKYIGDMEVYIPAFKKIVNKGDLVPEMPINEASVRKDFIVIYEEE